MSQPYTRPYLAVAAMIVRILSKGSSFQGLTTYLTHDAEAETAERVGWTHTLNCANDHVPSAINEMLWTARDAELLKQQAGVRSGGRATEDPVKHLSLNWAPDENPSREHMIATTEDFLRHMRWEEHQALVVAHTDIPGGRQEAEWTTMDGLDWQDAPNGSREAIPSAHLFGMGRHASSTRSAEDTGSRVGDAFATGILKLFDSFAEFVSPSLPDPDRPRPSAADDAFEKAAEDAHIRDEAYRDGQNARKKEEEDLEARRMARSQQ